MLGWQVFLRCYSVKTESVFPPRGLHLNETPGLEFRIGKEVSNACQLQQQCCSCPKQELGRAPASRHCRQPARVVVMPVWVGKSRAGPQRPRRFFGCSSSICKFPSSSVILWLIYVLKTAIRRDHFEQSLCFISYKQYPSLSSLTVVPYSKLKWPRS